jgi:hypothetical protein
MCAIGTAVVVVSAALLSLAESDTKTAGAHEYFRMKHVQVIDQSGFEKPIPAADLLIPTDWKFESKVQWGTADALQTLQQSVFGRRVPTAG